jgi:glycosyltransferase involved in cell wall biosynthesis
MIHVDGKKHVVVIGKYYPPELGGIEKYTEDVARSLSHKYRVTVVVHNTAVTDSIESRDGVTVIRCGTKRIVKAQPISPSMWRHLWRLKPDLIYFNAPNFWASAALNVIHRRCPIIITHHADVFGRRTLKLMVLPLYRALVRRSRHLVVNSIKNARISPDLPRDVPSIVEIPWGVDHTIFEPKDINDRALRLKRAERFGDAFVVGFVGRLVRYKGLSVLVRALDQVKDVCAIIVGDGPLRPHVEAQIAELGLQDRIHLTGRVSHARKIEEMHYMDAFVFPSLETTEAFGAAQIEAQLLKLPVIASDLPTGVTDITDETTGILVAPGDPTALANALKSLRDDRKRAIRLGEAGRNRALAKFTLRKFEERIVELIDSCFNEAAETIDQKRELAI